jgi:ABC-type phosphate transport system substrate-binding protein
MRNLLLALLFVVSSSQAEVAVIVHPKNVLDALSPQQVQDIFLGRARTFPNGRYALPIDQSSALRADFYQRLTHRPIEQINAYWARIVFTGQSSPPLQVPDDAAVLKTVRENEGAIGYVDRAHVDSFVRAVLILP